MSYTWNVSGLNKYTNFSINSFLIMKMMVEKAHILIAFRRLLFSVAEIGQVFVTEYLTVVFIFFCSFSISLK